MNKPESSSPQPSHPTPRHYHPKSALKGSDLQSTSKLSHGRRNPFRYHRTYRNNNRRIWRAIEQIISRRIISARVWHICYLATISSPTFYAHFRNADDARDKYENHIQADFRQGISLSLKRDTAFRLFLVFMKKNQSYFKAAFKGSDTALLRKLLIYYRPVFANIPVDNPSYDIYVCTLVGILYCWYKYDNMSNESQEFYVRKLINLRIKYF